MYYKYEIEVWFRYKGCEEKDFERIVVFADSDEDAILKSKEFRTGTYKSEIKSKTEYGNNLLSTTRD